MTIGEDGSIDKFVSPLDIGLSAFLLETCEGKEENKEKLYNSISEGGKI